MLWAINQSPCHLIYCFFANIINKMLCISKAYSKFKTIRRRRISALVFERLPMEKTLTKATIVEAIYEETGINRLEAKHVVEKLLHLMKGAIKKDHALLISGFGKFECYEKASRKGRNPQTEESIILPSRKVIVFRLSRKFRSELNP